MYTYKLVLFTAFLLFFSFRSSAQQVKKRPNVLVLLTDDQRYNTIHALGNKEINTPNIDKLVKSGTTFTQAHIMGALGGAVCQPSRAMLMTGRSIFQLRKDGGIIPSEDQTFPELFRQQGYQTFATGKWHSDKAAFNRSFSAADNIFFGGMHTLQDGGHWAPTLHHYDESGTYQEPFKGDQFSSIHYADAAIEFIENTDEQPFMMYVAFTSPHDPRTPPKEYEALYNPSQISLPGNFLPQHPFDNGDMDVRDEMLLSHPRNPDLVKKEIALYYAMISEVDHEIGRILEALRLRGQYENTIIVLAGDNGLALGQHGLLGKQSLYDHSVRVPLIFSGPGIPVDEKREAYCYLTDIFPTLCNLSGLSIPETVSGIPLDKAFYQPEFQGRPSLFLTYANLQRAVVQGDMKLIVYNVRGEHPVQLFDLLNDPLEKNNLADQAAYQPNVIALYKLLQSEMQRYGDFCDLTQAHWGYPQKLTWEEALKINP